VGGLPSAQFYSSKKFTKPSLKQQVEVVRPTPAKGNGSRMETAVKVKTNRKPIIDRQLNQIDERGESKLTDIKQQQLHERRNSKNATPIQDTLKDQLSLKNKRDSSVAKRAQ